MVEVKEAILLPSNVTHLVLRKPDNMKYKPGDYVYVCIPSIARDEWHPFSISSAPEQEGKMEKQSLKCNLLCMNTIWRINKYLIKLYQYKEYISSRYFRNSQAFTFL